MRNPLWSLRRIPGARAVGYACREALGRTLHHESPLVAALWGALTEADPAALTRLSPEYLREVRPEARKPLRGILGSFVPAAEGIRPEVIEPYNVASGNPDMDLGGCGMGPRNFKGYHDHAKRLQRKMER